MAKAPKHLYKVLFMNSGKVYEIYAREVSHGSLFGFLEVEGLLFGEKTKLVVDPAEEALQREFAGVERTFIPLHSVVRVDQVAKRGSAAIHTPPGDKVVAMPSPIYAPPPKGS